MNHRQRALAALAHQEPDRVPIDLGGTQVSGILAIPYQELRAQLHLTSGTTKVMDVYQQTAVIEGDVRELLEIDTLPVSREPAGWRKDTLSNGEPALFPEKFHPEHLADGSRVVRDEAGMVLLKMPAGGHYYDFIHAPLEGATSIQDIDSCMDEIEACDEPEHLDKSLEEITRQAKAWREEGKYLLVGYFGGHILYAAQSLRGWENFLMDLMVNQPFAEALMDRLLEAHLRRLERFAATFGQYVDVIEFDEDLGMQDRLLMSPAIYRKLLKPRQKQLFQHAKSLCNAYLLLHSDGAVAPLIPDLIEIGIDALNPIQVSAAGMDTRALKKEFGRHITFWGAGCDSQAVLPMGTVEMVEEEVKRRIDDLAPGGGFIFAPIHNIQVGVPARNTTAMFRTALEYGRY